MLTLEEIAAKLGIASATAKVWHRAGYLHGYRYDDRGQCLFESPGPNSPRRYKRKAGLYPFRAERSAAARSTGAV
jgi:predicted site-specific integrase-resolvase